MISISLSLTVDDQHRFLQIVFGWIYTHHVWHSMYPREYEWSDFVVRTRREMKRSIDNEVEKKLTYRRVVVLFSTTRINVFNFLNAR